MPIDPGSLFTGQISTDEIREFWMADRSPRTDSFTYKTANSHVTYWIPASKGWPDEFGDIPDTDSLSKLRGFIQLALGVDYVQQQGGTFFLRRQLPLFHPIHTSLYCDAIVSINGVAIRGDDPNEWSVTLQTTTPNKWDKHEVVLSFGVPKWRMRGDSQVTKEPQRYTQFRLNPSVQLVSVDQGGIVLDGTPGSNKPTLHAAQRRESAGVIITWYRVPAEWLYNTADADFGFSLPRKLLKAQGRVNKSVFFGEPAETMKLMKVDLGEPYVMPLITDIQGDQDEIHNPYFAYDVTMFFEWCDPEPRGKAGEDRHGHNFFLHSDLQYYYGTVQGSGIKTFPTCNFDKIFTHWSDAFVSNPDGSLD
jgi:hypothetical protein